MYAFELIFYRGICKLHSWKSYRWNYRKQFQQGTIIAAGPPERVDAFNKLNREPSHWLAPLPDRKTELE
jgi:hypothetical protein